MNSEWRIELFFQGYRDEWRREAGRRRRVRQGWAPRRRQGHVLHAFLAGLGQRLRAWGSRLEERYGALAQ
jgi:hypothetical protein